MSFPRLVNIPWSYSALDAFETCPRNYYTTRVVKIHKDTPNAAVAYGNQVHKAMEDYIKVQSALPPALTKFKRIADKLCTDALDVMTEVQYGIRSDGSPCKFFDDDVSLRVKADLLVLRPDSIVVADWKTSSEPRETDLQLKLSAVAALQRYPKYDACHGVYAYTQHPSRTMVTRREDIPAIVEEVNPRVARLERAKQMDNWPERQGWKCGFCPVTMCRFNRSGKR